MFLKILSYLPAIIGLFTIGFFVYLNNPKDIKNRTFSALNFLIGAWLFCLFIGDTTHNLSLALWSLRFGLFFGEFMFLMFYIFALVFPFKSTVNQKRQIAYFIPIIIVGILLFTPLGVQTVSIQDFGVQPEKVGFLYTFSDVVGIIYLLAGMIILMLKYRKSGIQEKNQIKFILFGLSIALSVNVFTGIVLTSLKIDTDAILFGSFSLFIFSAFVAYAIIKHGFLDVRLIVARTVGYILTIATIAGIYSAVLFGIFSRFIGTEHVTTIQQLLYILLAVFLAFTFQSIKRFFDKLSNRLFYRDAYEPQVLLNQLSSLLVSSIDLRNILDQSAVIIQKHIKSDFVAFRINRLQTSQTGIYGKGNFSNDELEKFFKDNYLKFRDQITITEDQQESSQLLTQNLSRLNISVVTKMQSLSQKSTVGFLILGPKKSGNLYNEQDIRVLKIITDELVVAAQNALRFEEIQQFNITLQDKVNNATKQLRKANERLKALDETKDEFISMASHQLRTPLTTVKGYVSMVLDGDAGKITASQRHLLDQSFLSAQRMVYLIADLLNVSRLRTGKFVIDSSPTNLADVVEGEIEQLQETAKAHKLILEYTKPQNFPTLMLDETKIRQVIMNFADNAIYYTPSGGTIKIKLIDKPESIEFTVVDNGIGVPKPLQHHLFTKFYRADNAKKARPDGTGLGLFMAQKVIVAQGGSIIFHSEENKGSTFGFSFNKANLISNSKTKK